MVFTNSTLSQPSFFSTLQPDNLISFKYFGGNYPGTERTVSFVSWFLSTPNSKGDTEGYLTAHDSSGMLKTYHYSKMTHLKLIPTQVPNTPHSENITQNNLSKWTSSIKEGDIIQFTYMNQTQIRNVTFIHFMDRHSPTKLKIMSLENGYTKTFFISKMTIHKISQLEQNYSKKDFDSSQEVLQNQTVQTESKKDILIKQMKAHIDSQNIMIENFKARMFLLEDDCAHLEEDKINAYTIMSLHKRRYPSTWKNDFQPKELSGWEIINSTTSQ
jgi:hypothetical protein